MLQTIISIIESLLVIVFTLTFVAFVTVSVGKTMASMQKRVGASNRITLLSMWSLGTVVPGSVSEEVSRRPEFRRLELIEQAANVDEEIARSAFDKVQEWARGANVIMDKSQISNVNGPFTNVSVNTENGTVTFTMQPYNIMSDQVNGHVNNTQDILQRATNSFNLVDPAVTNTRETLVEGINACDRAIELLQYGLPLDRFLAEMCPDYVSTLIPRLQNLISLFDSFL